MDDRENMPAAFDVSSGVVVENIGVNCTRNMKLLEYARLRSLVPSVASRSRVSKIQVIEEAIKYIALLQQALRTQPSTETEIQEVTQQNTTSSTTETRSKTLRPKRQRLASYMIKPQRHSPKSRPKFSKSTSKKRTKYLRI